MKTKRANVRNEASLTNAEKEGYLNDLTNLSVKIQDYEKFLDQQIAGSAILQSVVSPGGVEGNNYGKKTTASVLTIKPPVQGKGSAPGGAAKSNFERYEVRE